MAETIKTYQGPDVSVSQCLVTLECFVGDMDNAELADDSTVDTSDAVTAINGLIWSLERREARINQLGAALKAIQDGTVKGTVGGEDVVWFDGITTLHDFCDQALNHEQDAGGMK